MGAITKPILLDAVTVIHLLEWGRYWAVCQALGNLACLSEFVASNEVKYHVDRASGRRIRFDPAKVTPTSVPRLVTVDQLSAEQYERYLEHFNILKGADKGEREMFALAWVLGYDVCSWDGGALDLFREHRPKGCTSRYIPTLDLLRSLKLLQ